MANIKGGFQYIDCEGIEFTEDGLNKVEIPRDILESDDNDKILILKNVKFPGTQKLKVVFDCYSLQAGCYFKHISIGSPGSITDYLLGFTFSGNDNKAGCVLVALA